MNIQALMKQAQQMQKDIEKSKNEIDSMTFEGKSSLVTVKVNGKKEVLEIKIEEQEEIKEDLSILEDMILLAVNDAMKKVDQATNEKMKKYSNMMPGMF